MRDVFAGEGVEDERILDGAAAGLRAVDFSQRDDLAYMCARIEAPGEKPFVIRRRLAREHQELRQQALLAGAFALLEQGLRMIGIFDVLVAIEAAHVPGNEP